MDLNRHIFEHWLEVPRERKIVSFVHVLLKPSTAGAAPHFVSTISSNVSISIHSKNSFCSAMICREENYPDLEKRMNNETRGPFKAWVPKLFYAMPPPPKLFITLHLIIILLTCFKHIKLWRKKIFFKHFLAIVQQKKSNLSQALK